MVLGNILVIWLEIFWPFGLKKNRKKKTERERETLNLAL